ncbi:MAG: VWA domain-containing protein [Myxococcota bacterium]
MALTAAALLAPRAATADQFEATRSQQLVERAHVIDVSVDRGHATMRVRRTVFNGGTRHDQATFHIDVPDGAVATGLRTLAVQNGKPKWFDGVLMEAEEAAAKYRELTGLGGYYPKDPALLSWRSQETLALQVFPCQPEQPKTVEYTLTVPAEYRDGLYRLALEELGTKSISAELVVRPARDGDTLFVDDAAVRPGTKIHANRHRDIALAPANAAQIDSHLAVVETGEHRLVRYELALAPQLSEIPERAGVVVLMDTSISVDSNTLEGQLAAARAYLQHFARPSLRARAEVVPFDRKPRALSKRLRPVGKVLDDLDGMVPTQRNGSHVDAALQHAATMLRDVPKDRRRIVLLTDARMREALTPTRVAAATRGTGALVHIGFVDNSGSPTLQRNDDDEWSAAAATTGGVLWQAGTSESAYDHDEMVSTYLEWARPIRVDGPRVLAPGLAEDELDLPESLPEGFGTSLLLLQDASVRHVIVSGALWSTPVHDIAAPDEAFGTRWSALVFGSDVQSELSEPEAMVLAMRGGAVSPVTSYLAIEPGVRPSTEGLEWGMIGRGGGGGGSGVGFGSGAGAGFGGRRGRKFDPHVFLATHVRLAADACGVPKDIAIKTELQTTIDEIVEVEGVDFVGYLDTKQNDCLREGVWSIELPGEFRAEWQRWTVRA